MERLEQGVGQLPEKDRALLRQQRFGQGDARRRGLLQKAGLPGGVRCGRGNAPAGSQHGHLLPRFEKGPVGAGEGRFQAAFAPAEGAFGVGEGRLCELCRVHRAGPVGQIVRLVDEKEPVARRIEEAVEPDHRVKEIVVVADDDVGPCTQVKPQFERADRELPGGGFQRGAVELRGTVQQGGKGIFDPFVVAVGVGAGFGQAGGMALGVLAEADLLLGRQGHAAQGQPRCAGVEPREGILGSGLGRAAGREVEQLFAAARADGLEGREEGAHGLADAGGGLTEQPGAVFLPAPARDAGAVDLARQCPLAGAVGREGECQGRQTGGAGLGPGHLPPCPGGVLPQQAGEEGVQLPGGEVPGVAGDLVGVDLVIGQPDAEPLQLVLRSVDGPIHHALRPVAGVPVFGQLLGGKGRGLDLVDDDGAVFVLENAVGAAFQHKQKALHLALRRQIDLGSVAFARCFLQPAVDACSLVGTVEAGEAAVDAAGAEQKFHQLPDGQTNRLRGGHEQYLAFTTLL